MDTVGLSEVVFGAVITTTDNEPAVVRATIPRPVDEETPLEREQDAQGVRLANPPPGDSGRGVSGDGQGD